MIHIKKFGVELEGRFDKEVYAKARSLNIWHNDSSVMRLEGTVPGEIVSPACDNIESLKNFIRTWYPKEVDDSCGFHIHVSFNKNLDYSRLASKTFQRHFIKK